MKKQIGYAFTALAFLTINSTLAAPVELPRAEMVRKNIQQLNNRLAGVEQSYTIAMTQMLEEELKGYSNQDLTNNNLMEQLRSSIISNYARQLAGQRARQRSSNGQKIDEFVTMWHNEANKKLINNEPLDAFFNKGLENIAAMYFPQQQPLYIKEPIHPQPSAPVAQPYSTTTVKALYRANPGDIKNLRNGQKNISALAPFLSGLSLRNQTRLEGFFFQSIQQNPTEQNTAVHVQNAKLALYDYHLRRTHVNLMQEIDNTKLQKAIQAADAIGSLQVKKLTPQQGAQFARILANLEEIILDNAGTDCPVCTQPYKQHDTFGVVDKIRCQASQCQSVCRECAKTGSFSTCPTCKTSHINQSDLRQQPENLTNWRPS